MSKSNERLKAIDLRKEGKSVGEIARTLSVSKSSISLWTRHIALTIEQVEKLRHNSLVGSERTRIQQAMKLKNNRLKLIETKNKEGELEFNFLNKKELDIAGLCLYWSEGSKKSRRIELCNSDPNLIKAFVKWLKNCYQISLNELHCYVGINEAHRLREKEVIAYWHKITRIPLTNFTKTSFKQYPLRKYYENFNEHYGTLVVKVERPARIFYKILGKIHGLSKNLAT